jgi:hypothetical protein
MAYTFFPKSANEIATTLAKKDPEVILEITKLFAHLKANAKIIKAIDTPINIDPASIKQINVSRKLKDITPPLNLATLKTKLKLKKINIKFGDGSAGGRGVNNKGGKFEKQEVLVAALNDQSALIYAGLESGDEVYLSTPGDTSGIDLEKVVQKPAPPKPWIDPKEQQKLLDHLAKTQSAKRNNGMPEESVVTAE